MKEQRSPSIQVKSRIAGARPLRLFAGRLRGDLDTVVSVALRRSRNAATPRSMNLVKISAVIWKATRSAPVKIPSATG